MAEIEIEKKSPDKRPVWPWLVGVLVLVLLLAGWLIFEANETEDDDDINVEETGLLLQPYPDDYFYAFEQQPATELIRTRI